MRYGARQYGGIAQLVEHSVHTRSVICSSQIAATRPVGQKVKTPPFHGGNMGSIPVRVTKKSRHLYDVWIFLRPVHGTNPLGSTARKFCASAQRRHIVPPVFGRRPKQYPGGTEAAQPLEYSHTIPQLIRRIRISCGLIDKVRRIQRENHQASTSQLGSSLCLPFWLFFVTIAPVKALMMGGPEHHDIRNVRYPRQCGTILFRHEADQPAAGGYALCAGRRH